MRFNKAALCLILLLTLFSCESHRYPRELVVADSLVSIHPDSALQLLHQWEPQLGGIVMSEEFEMMLRVFIALCDLALCMLICGMMMGFDTNLFRNMSLIPMFFFLGYLFTTAYKYSKKQKKANKAES